MKPSPIFVAIFSTILAGFLVAPEGHHGATRDAHAMERNAIPDNQKSGETPYSVIDEEAIANAPCRKQPEIADLEAEMEAISVGRDDYRLRGFELKNQPASLVEALAELIRQSKPDGSVSESQPEISAHDYLKTLCDTAVCVAQKLFGKRIGVQVLYLKWKYGLNASHMTNDNASHIEEPEAASLLRVASDFPPELWPEDSNKRMVKYERGVQMVSRYGGLSLANSKIEFFDGWTRLAPDAKDVITAHELAHYIGDLTGLHTSQSWLRVSDWQKAEGSWTAGKSAQLLSSNSTKSPQEDFAEAVTAYRYAPDKLRDKSPQKYEFLKHRVFEGVEYRGPEGCHDHLNQ